MVATTLPEGYASWDLPFGTGRAFLSSANKWLNGLVGGWTLSGVFRYSSGQPIGIASSNWYSGWDAVIYANDTSGITNPAYGEFGAGPRAMSALRGFGTAREDVGIMKNFKIGKPSDCSSGWSSTT